MQVHKEESNNLRSIVRSNTRFNSFAIVLAQPRTFNYNHSGNVQEPITSNSNKIAASKFILESPWLIESIIASQKIFRRLLLGREI